MRTRSREATEERVPESEDVSSTEPRLQMSGHIKMASGIPAADAHLVLFRQSVPQMTEPEEDDQVASATADSEGNYRISAPDSPLFKLKIDRKGAARATFMVLDASAWGSGGSEQQGLRRLKRDFTLVPASTVRGRVETEAGAPIPNITIRAGAEISAQRVSPEGMQSNESETVSGSDGTFMLDDVPVGNLQLSVSEEAYVPLTETVTAPAENVVLKVAENGGVIEGSVRMLKTEASVAGATVTAVVLPAKVRTSLRLPPRTGVSGADGSFRIDKLPAGRLRLHAAAQDLFSATPGVNIVELAGTETTSGLVLYLYPGTTITGKVTERDTGAPIAGAKVSMGYWMGPSQQKDVAETDAEGVYRLGPTAARGQMPVRVEKDGYSVYAKSSMQFAPAQLQVRLDVDQPETRFDIQMVKTTTISGVVQVAEGKGVAGASVSLVGARHMGPTRQKTVLTDTSGAFDIDCAPGQDVRVRAEAAGFPATFSDPISVQEKPVTGVKITLRPGAIVTGQVVDPDGSPVAGAQVRAGTTVRLGNWSTVERSKEVMSGTGGEFTVIDLPDGTAAFTTSKKGYSTSIQEVTGIRAGETLSGVRLKLGKSHFIAGKITDEAGKPIEGANVSCHMTSGSGSGNATSDDSGAYRIDDLPAGVYSVNVWHTTGNDRKDSVNVDRDDVNLVLKKRPMSSASGSAAKSVTLVGKVVDSATKSPVEDFDVSNYHGGIASTSRDASQPGTFTWRGTSGRTLRLRIEARGYAVLDTGNFAIPEGEETFTKTFELSKGNVLKGRVVSAKGQQPLADVRVSFKGAFEQEYQAAQAPPLSNVVTASDGLFRFESVSPGRNFIALRPPGSISELTRTFFVKDDQDFDAGDIVIESGLVVRGKVVRTPGDAGVQDALVVITAESQSSGLGGSSEMHTDTAGAFAFQGLTRGRYYLSAPDFKLASSVDLSSKDEEEITLRVGSAILKGTVMRGTAPVAAGITLSREQVNLSMRTQGDGGFEIKDLEPGKWHYLVSSPGMWESRDEGDLEIQEGVNERNFSLPAGRVVGRVVDPGGSPVEEAEVQLKRAADSQMKSPANMTRRTSGDGSFAFEGLEEGTYDISASKTGGGYVPKSSLTVPKDGAPPPVELKLITDGGTLVSIVSSEVNGQPLPEARCSLNSQGGAVPFFSHNSTRDASGRMEITGIPPGKWYVHIYADWCVPATHEVEIEVGQTVTLTDTLPEAGEFRWTLTDAHGAPIPYLMCGLSQEVAPGGSFVTGGTTDQNGVWSLKTLRPGQYAAKATPQGKNPVEVPVTISPRQTTALTTKIE